jgi:geranylgeranyl transferase type-2 subunit beta
MNPSPYLDLLDATLASGLLDLSAAFVDTQVAFVAGCQLPDGGFRGRQGGSDLYYTDFALRSLALLAPAHPAFIGAQVNNVACCKPAAPVYRPPVGRPGDILILSRNSRTADWLDRRPPVLSGVVECFSLLSIRRTLERCRTASVQNPPLPPFRELPAVKEQLLNHLLPSGGLARFPSDAQVSAYHTFLGALCFQMLGEALPGTPAALRSIRALRRTDGGYAGLDGQVASQTNATAAAVAFLRMHDALPPEDAAAVGNFFARLQAADGGLKAHAAAAAGDLLSTFTGLATLAAIDGEQSIDMAAVGGFLRAAAHPCGGFLACADDDLPDVEYTYYGTAVLALLRTFGQR